MARHLSAWQWVGVIFVIVLLAIGAWQLRLRRAWSERFARWQTDVPLRVRLKPGLNGDYIAEFTQTCAIAHAQRLMLEPQDATDLERVLAAAKAMQITGEVEALGDSERRAAELAGWEPMEWDAGVIVARVSPPPRDGRCCLRIKLRGANADVPDSVDLVMRNELCGLEAMPGLVHAGIGILSLAVGGVSALVIAAWIGARWNRPTPSPRP